jgi:FdhE protein
VSTGKRARKDEKPVNAQAIDCVSRWEAQVRRARELSGEHSPAYDLLHFYEMVLLFQRDTAAACAAKLDSTVPLREQIDFAFASSRIPALLALAAEHGPEALSVHARQLKEEGPASWQTMLESALVQGKSGLDPMHDFFARSCLQPIAEKLQSQLPIDANYTGNWCPACGGMPQLAILRPEGEGASRSLGCSFCLREWLFRRIVCPYCGEEDKEKLPRYSAEECAHVHIEACDTCRRYLKAVDMTIDGHAEPLVDEAAMAALDVWATERGYAKIVKNLIGF